MPTSWSLASDTTHADKERSMMLTQEKSFGEETEEGVNLDEPVGQDPSHWPRKFLLARHVVRIREHGELWEEDKSAD